MEKHIFRRLIDAQRKSGTLYCGGFDIHPMEDLLQNSWLSNMKIYGFRNSGKIDTTSEAYGIYETAVSLEGLRGDECKRYAGLLAAIDNYLHYVLEISVHKCNLSVFKPQFGLYIQFGPSGMYLLQRLRRRAEQLSAEVKRPIIVILDAKPGDIATTQAGYMRGYLGNLLSAWGINHSPFDFDIVNPTPWMGEDVLCLQRKEKDGTTKSAIGLNLLREGKGLVYVNKTSNPSGKQYQELLVRTNGDREMALYLKNAEDAHKISKKYHLNGDDVSQLGLVVGATNPCTGQIRSVYPTHTSLNPGFGAQNKEKKDATPLRPYKQVILELRCDQEFNGLGAIWSSSRNHLFAWKKEYGGDGCVNRMEENLVRSVNEHRALEEEAFQLPEVIDAGIRYPF